MKSINKIKMKMKLRANENRKQNSMPKWWNEWKVSQSRNTKQKLNFECKDEWMRKCLIKKKEGDLQTDQFKWDFTVLAMAADRIFHADSAITNSNGRTMFLAQAAYYSLFVTHSNSNSANFGPNERTVEWATYSVLCLCTLCLVCIVTIFWLPLVRWILEQLWPLPFAYFHHLIMS